jgi:hypothetical protein
MDAAAELWEIESIKQLKARYCRYLDTKDWAAWRTIFADDFVSDTAESGGRVIVGADEFVTYIRKTLGKPSQPTVHQVHAPEIELVSETTARGVWALQDVVRLAPGVNLNGYGHYHETYEKIDGQWRIKSSKLTRLREDDLQSCFQSSSFTAAPQRRRQSGATFLAVISLNAKHPRPRRTWDVWFVLVGLTGRGTPAGRSRWPRRPPLRTRLRSPHPVRHRTHRPGSTAGWRRHR